MALAVIVVCAAVDVTTPPLLLIVPEIRLLAAKRFAKFIVLLRAVLGCISITPSILVLLVAILKKLIVVWFTPDEISLKVDVGDTDKTVSGETIFPKVRIRFVKVLSKLMFVALAT